MKTVILLNGPSSSGKSTLSKALKTLLKEKENVNYEVVSVDDFMKISTSETIYEDDVFDISKDMCDKVEELLGDYDGVIVDHVITSKRIFEQFMNMAKSYNYLLVHVTCPLNVLLERENKRGNRCLGSAKNSFNYLYPKDGYNLTIDTSLLSVEECSLTIYNELKKPYKCIHFEEIDSTNKYLKENHHLDDLTFVSTAYQNKGKGRNDRVWLSNKGENLMFSLLLKNKKQVSKGGFLSLITSYSVSRILSEKYHLSNVLIKWPNDVYVNNKKICGILLEGNIPEYIVIGVGLNVNQEIFAGEYRKTPTSIYLEKGHKICINILKEAVFAALFEDITNEKDYISYFNNHNYLKDKKVKVKQDNKDIIGVVSGVDEHYNLIIKDKEKEYLISSGEIEIF